MLAAVVYLVNLESSSNCCQLIYNSISFTKVARVNKLVVFCFRQFCAEHTTSGAFSSKHKHFAIRLIKYMYFQFLLTQLNLHVKANNIDFVVGK